MIKQISVEAIRNAIITDQATGAGDYAEAEEYANKIIAQAKGNDPQNPADESGTGRVLAQVNDLAMLVRRLVQRVRKYNASDDVASSATDYLIRMNLQGKVTRDAGRTGSRH